jgi:magnesium transporter
MIRKLADKQEHPYEWIDISDPGVPELNEIAAKYGFHEASVNDSLQPDHLPKSEHFKNYQFVILRVYDEENSIEADTVPEVSNKISVFIGMDFIVTVHKKNWAALDVINKKCVQVRECSTSFQVLNEIIKAALHSFEIAGHKLNHAIEYYEEQVFLKERRAPLLKGLYFVKRKVDVIRHLLLLSYEIIDGVDPVDNSTAETRDIRDLYVKQQSFFDALSENTNHLLNIYFNISAQRNNETIRILTIFSVFFMPLTFIVGIYGMNFDFMPELRVKWGYPLVIILMITVTIIIYSWFKKKKWL